MTKFKNSLMKLIQSNRYSKQSILAKIEALHESGKLTDAEYSELIATTEEEEEENEQD